MFDIGDTVRVIDPGYSYSAYSEWGNKYLSNFAHGKTPHKGLVCEIVAKEYHSKKDRSIIYGIRDIAGWEFIIGMRGIRFIKKRNYAEDFFGDLFQI